MFLAINMENMMQALSIMWQGMLGIFVVICLIALVVRLMTYLADQKIKKEKEKQQQANTEQQE